MNKVYKTSLMIFIPLGYISNLFLMFMYDPMEIMIVNLLLIVYMLALPSLLELASLILHK